MTVFAVVLDRTEAGQLQQESIIHDSYHPAQPQEVQTHAKPSCSSSTKRCHSTTSMIVL